VRMLSVGENSTMTIVDRLANRLGVLLPEKGTPPPGPSPEAVDCFRRALTAGRRAVRRQPAEGDGGAGGCETPKLVVAITPTRGVDVASKATLLELCPRWPATRGRLSCWPPTTWTTSLSATG